eukprot:3648154-Pyramimonas_sp.AAC.1
MGCEYRARTGACSCPNPPYGCIKPDTRPRDTGFKISFPQVIIFPVPLSLSRVRSSLHHPKSHIWEYCHLTERTMVARFDRMVTCLVRQGVNSYRDLRLGGNPSSNKPARHAPSNKATDETSYNDEGIPVRYGSRVPQTGPAREPTVSSASDPSPPPPAPLPLEFTVPVFRQGCRSSRYIPGAGTNRRRDERIYPVRGPIGGGKYHLSTALNPNRPPAVRIAQTFNA